MTTDTIITITCIAIIIAMICGIFYAYYRLLNPKRIIYPQSTITTEMIIASLRKQSQQLADIASAEPFIVSRLILPRGMRNYRKNVANGLNKTNLLYSKSNSKETGRPK